LKFELAARRAQIRNIHQLIKADNQS